MVTAATGSAAGYSARMDAPRQGVLLVNLGTADAPTPRAVRRYLREFLGDPRVLDMPAPLRWLLLNGAILPTRPRRAAAAYQKIWTPEGSPLVVNGFALRDALRKELGDDWVVELGMRYGVPSIDAAVERLAASDVERIQVVPLFPQYASASTGSALDAVSPPPPSATMCRRSRSSRPSTPSPASSGASRRSRARSPRSSSPTTS
jgi:ferrochelatase